MKQTNVETPGISAQKREMKKLKL